MLSDNPIHHKTEDMLTRSELAKNLAKVIYSRTGNESFVIGIDGKWGSGKTSFINLILENFCPCQFIVYKFNPWILNSHEDLVKSFMKGLFDAISEDLPISYQVYKKFQKYTEDITSANFSIPLLSWLPISLGISRNETSLEKRKEDINKYLCCLRRKVVIVIDDLDRLTPDDVKTVVKTIKSIADFRNTTFLIAYDREIIANYLNEADKGFTGKEYLKKIVNVNYFIPIPDKNDVSSFLFTKLNKLLIQHFGTDDIDNDRWAKIFNGGVDKLIENMRDAKLLVNSLKVTLPTLSISDVNPVDAIAIEIVRVFAPETYSEIAGHDEIFSGGLFSVRDDYAERKKIADATIDLSFNEQSKEKYKHEGIKTIIHELFPRISSSGYDGGDWQEAWTREKRVCSYEKFPFYFRFGIPTGSISNSELDFFVERVKQSISYSEIEDVLKEYDKKKKLTKFTGRLFNYLKNLEQDKVKNLLFALWKIDETVMYQNPDEGGPFFDLSGSITRLVFNVVKNNIEEKDRMNFLKDVSNTSTIFYGPVRLLGIANNLIKEKKDTNELLVPESDQEEIKKIGLDLINKNKDKLMGHPYMLSLLFYWDTFEGNDTNIKAWLEENLTTETIAIFLSGATGRSYSSRGGAETIIHRESLEKFDILKKVETLVADMSENQKISMTPKQKVAVDAFLKPKSSLF